MKKATAGNKTKTLTLEKIRARKTTKRQREEIASLESLPDSKIDTDDIPEVTAAGAWMNNPFYKPVTRSITIRLNAPDIAVAQALSKSKGLPYQTYIKQLLHSALERELSASRQ
jgi:predicted DNA binding CopG/RHH family protein